MKYCVLEAGSQVTNQFPPRFCWFESTHSAVMSSKVSFSVSHTACYGNITELRLVKLLWTPVFRAPGRV